MTNVRSFPSLQDSDRVVITGATGWMGREVLDRLARTRPEIQVLPIASRARSLEIGDRTHQVHAWSHAYIAEWRPTIAVHLAFLTREAESTMSTAEYERRNRELTESAVHLFSIPELRAAVIASSGAAIRPKGQIYGELKARDEQVFTELGNRTGVPTVISRIWSVSGAFCTKPNLFALFDLIEQTRHRPSVHIRARSEVWRRYVDAGEFLEICVSAAGAEASEVIDSAGPLVEIEHLAHVIQDVLGEKRAIVREMVTQPPDRYFTDSHNMESWSERLGLPLASLTEQVRRSAQVVTSPRNRTDS